jgi:hypothetical protein
MRLGPLCLVVAVVVVLALPGAAAAARTPLTVSPAPGTPDASPKTGISVLGVPAGRIASVRVVGSSSGLHRGRIAPFSRNRGGIFVPDAPLTEGERVTVVVRVRGRSPDRFSFVVAHLGADPPLLSPTQIQPDKLEHFASEPGLTPPRITVLKHSSGFSDRIFLTPLPSPIVHPGSTQTVTLTPVGPGGPMIVDGQGHVVWFHQLQLPEVAGNLRIQHYAGKPVLTWWQGPVTVAAYGLGEGVIADTRYRTLHVVHAGNGYAMDIHEFSLTPEGDALFTVYSPVLVHLPDTPPGTLTSLIDAIVQEVDVRTGLVTWEWHALGHIPLRDSYATPANSAFYDAFHINSIQPLARGRVLISSRDASAVYELDRATGHIVWTLGGKASDFRMARGARFWFQHDAALRSGNRVSLFDDGAGPPQREPASRGLILALDLRRHVARMDRQYRRSNDTSAQSEGSLQMLPGGDAFAGFGATPYFSQFTNAGKLVFDASLPADDGSYRVYSFLWSTTPTTKPAVAAQRVGASTVAVYASWNGATTVARWQVLAGADAGSLRPVGTPARRTDFETRIAVPSSAPAFAVRALDAHGHVLATSPVATAAG